MSSEPFLIQLAFFQIEFFVSVSMHKQRSRGLMHASLSSGIGSGGAKNPMRSVEDISQR
jgi:hypothetical protein